MRRRRAIVLGAAAIMALGALPACTGGGSGSDGDGLGAASVSSPAPALSGRTVQGHTASLADLRGNVVVVNVWATWCDPCREEQPDLVKLAKEYEGRGVEFLGVDERDDLAKARAWVKEFDVPYASIVDESGAWADDFAFFGLPDTYVIDRSGTIRWAVAGQTDAAQVRQLIEQVLALGS
jgi:cytochrome c biogenesis protein CcmG, thiol:disulfide interchange protein DsbE